MATFGPKSDAASRAVDCASGPGNSGADDRPEVEAAASAEICSGERPFSSVVLEEDSAIRSCELSTGESRDCRALRAFKAAICRLPASSSFLTEVSSRVRASARRGPLPARRLYERLLRRVLRRSGWHGFRACDPRGIEFRPEGGKLARDGLCPAPLLFERLLLLDLCRGGLHGFRTCDPRGI